MRLFREKIIGFISTFIFILATKNFLFCQTVIERPQLVIQSGHVESIKSLAFSPNGEFLASASYDETVKIWDVATGLLIHTLEGHKQSVNAVAFSPDGKWLASGSSDGTVKVWETARFRLLHTLKYGSSWIPAIAFSPDGRWITCGAGSSIISWDVITGEVAHRLYNNRQVKALAYSPDGKWLASGSMSQPEIKVWEITSKKVVKAFEGNSERGEISALDFSHDGKWLAASVGGREIKVWQVFGWQPVQTLEGWGNIAFSPISELLVVSAGMLIKIYNVATGKNILSINNNESAVGSIAFSPDGQLLVSGDYSNSINFWNAANGKLISSIESNSYGVFSVAVSPNGRWLACGTKEGIKVFNLSTGRLNFIRAESGYSPHIVYSPDSKWLASNKGSFVVLLDANNYQLIHQLIGHFNAVNHMAFSPDGKRLASVSSYGDNAIRLWDLESGQHVNSIEDSAGSSGTLAYSPDGQWLASASSSAIKLWDAAKGQLLRTLKSGSGNSSIVFSPDGNYIASINWSEIKIFDVTADTLLHSMRGHSESISSIVYSPDGRWLASGSNDNTIKVWDTTTGRLVRTLEGHRGSVKSVSYFSDSRFFVSGGEDAQMKLWDTEKWTNIASVLCFNQFDWICYTPEGYFDCSDAASQYITWRIGNKVEFNEQNFSRYHRPGLLARILQGEWNQRGGIEAAPEVTILSPGDGQRFTKEAIEVEVEAKNMGDGIEDIRLTHNGNLIQEDHRGLTKPDTVGNEVLFAKFNVNLIEGINTLRAIAFNREKSDSNGYEIKVELTSHDENASAYLLMVGINKYKNEALNLNYAQTDAEELSGLLQSRGQHLFKSVAAYNLFDHKATGKSIRRAFQNIKKRADLEDVLVILLAGHGEIVDNQFYLLPYETKDIEDEAHIERVGISAKEIGHFLTEIKAQKILLLIDACKSGQVLLALKGIEEQIDRKQLTSFSGIYILAAATRNQSAGEIRELGHGIFTYAIIEGLNGQADTLPSDGIITVEELIAYVKRRVPTLAKQYRKGEQFPISDSKRAINFSISAK